MGRYGVYRLTDTSRIVKAVIVGDRRPLKFTPRKQTEPLRQSRCQSVNSLSWYRCPWWSARYSASGIRLYRHEGFFPVLGYDKFRVKRPILLLLVFKFFPLNGSHKYDFLVRYLYDSSVISVNANIIFYLFQSNTICIKRWKRKPCSHEQGYSKTTKNVNSVFI